MIISIISDNGILATFKKSFTCKLFFINIEEC